MCPSKEGFRERVISLRRSVDVRPKLAGSPEDFPGFTDPDDNEFEPVIPREMIKPTTSCPQYGVASADVFTWQTPGKLTRYR